ncbi:uncharacterized protein LOC143294626 [Babylonia areolata]|uniref:uncharacterized protein LOC143294626 n=1 Tax=Babylonia areolata TaxID=304850 RepID=UPI003FD4AE69
MASTKTYRLRIETEDPLYNGQKKLKVKGKDLARLSTSVFNLLELEVLDLSPEREACLDFKLITLPPGIGRLVNLSVLMLDTNDLEEVPSELGLLRNLERLALSNNRLSSLPAEFQNLQRLRSLHMANNQFQDLPVVLCAITSLEFLDMSDNQIKVVPEKISQLRNLQTLLLFINQLSKLPDSLCELPDLRCLWVGNNRLRALPRNFGRLHHLDWGHRYTSSALDGNPLVHPPLEVCRMGPEAVERYMTSMDRSSNSNKASRDREKERERDRERERDSRDKPRGETDRTTARDGGGGGRERERDRDVALLSRRAHPNSPINTATPRPEVTASYQCEVAVWPATHRRSSRSAGTETIADDV